MSYPDHRPRRMRAREALRRLVRETDLTPRNLIAPLFVKEGIPEPAEISSMPGQSQHTLESLRKEAVDIASRGVRDFVLFGVPARKDAEGSESHTPKGVAQQGLRALKEELGEDAVVIADLCLDEYTDHGHCGVLTDDGQVDNDRTLEVYRKIAVAQAEAGADIVMVKPALSYLDVVRTVKDATGFPLAAYNVSGEYSMVKAAAERGWIDERKITLEILTGIRRAG